MAPGVFFLALLLSLQVVFTYGQKGNRYYGDGIQQNDIGFLHLSYRMTRDTCTNFLFFRSLDGTCTNPGYPTSGKANSPFNSYFRGQNARKMDIKENSARRISNIVCQQTQPDKYDNKIRLTEFVTNFGQFLDHSIVLTSNDMDSTVDIPVPSDDRRCDQRVIRFNRNIKANRRGVINGRGRLRAINVVSSAVDLFGVYGHGDLTKNLRSGVDGMLRVSGGDKCLLPINDLRIINGRSSSMNAPKKGVKYRHNYFIAGDSRSNENPQLTALHVIWMRNHNRWAKRLKSDFPEHDGDDDWLFDSARRINQAQFQSVVYNEFLPLMTGKTLPKCPLQAKKIQCFDQKVRPGISDLFATAAFRVGHTMVGNKVHRIGKFKNKMAPLELKEAFFPERYLLERDGIEPYIRGAIANRAQAIDNEIVDALRNSLFDNVKEEEGFDLAAINIQRGRDENLPTYVRIREHFTGERVNSFSQISSNSEVQKRLKTAYYDKVEDVEAWVGLISEDHAPGSPMGKTLGTIWLKEFQNLRDSDYYFYQNENVYPPELRNYGALWNIIHGSGENMRDIILENTNIKASEISGNIWKFS